MTANMDYYRLCWRRDPLLFGEVDERLLRAIASDVCQEQGICCESARFVPSDISDVHWSQGREEIVQEVSDLLEGLPPDIMIEFLYPVIAVAVDPLAHTTDSLREYSGKGGTVRSSRNEYSRCNELESSTNLDSSMPYLREFGYPLATSLIHVYRGPNPDKGKAIRANPAFQTVIVNSLLEDSDPGFLDFVVYRGASSAYHDQVSSENRCDANVARDRRISDCLGSAMMQSMLLSLRPRNMGVCRCAGEL